MNSPELYLKVIIFIHKIEYFCTSIKCLKQNIDNYSVCIILENTIAHTCNSFFFCVRNLLILKPRSSIPKKRQACLRATINGVSQRLEDNLPQLARAQKK